MSDSLKLKHEFIKKLAKYLVGSEALKSIELSVEAQRADGDVRHKWASEWVEVRSASPIRGYTELSKAEAQLMEFLG